MKRNKGSRFINLHSNCLKRSPAYSRGFTLIELLVVIAIIGILSTVVLASLNSARAKGADAAIKSGLANARSQAELYASSGTTFSYDLVCRGLTSQGGILDMWTSAVKNSNASYYYPVDTIPSSSTVAACHDSTDGWAAAVPLKAPTTAGDSFCVDSTGASKVIPSSKVLSANDVTCD